MYPFYRRIDQAAQEIASDSAQLPYVANLISPNSRRRNFSMFCSYVFAFGNQYWPGRSRLDRDASSDSDSSHLSAA